MIFFCPSFIFIKVFIFETNENISLTFIYKKYGDGSRREKNYQRFGQKNVCLQRKKQFLRCSKPAVLLGDEPLGKCIALLTWCWNIFQLEVNQL